MDDPQTILDISQTGFAILLLAMLAYMLLLAALSHTTPPKRG